MNVIELGGGSNSRYARKFGNGVNVDIRQAEGVDVVADFEKRLPFENEEFDGLYSCFVLEHVSWRYVKGFIKEMHRILKKGAKGVIVTANLLEQCRVIANSTEWEENFSCMIFGDLDYPENNHKCGFSPDWARKLFEEAGFTVLKIEPLPNCATDLFIEVVK